MSVNKIKGNLLDFPEDINVIVHCANCQNTFGSGIAAQIREEYPVAYEADTKHHELCKKDGKQQLGTYSVATLVNGKRIINLYAQNLFGTSHRQVDYEAFYVGLEDIRDVLEKATKAGRPWNLGIPYKIASDRAGGNWTIIETMINELFKDSPVKCYIVEWDGYKK